MISNSITSFGQTNSTVTNQTNTANSSNSGTIKLIDSSISMIKSGDNEGATKSLLQAELGLEGKSNLSGVEKHIEA